MLRCGQNASSIVGVSRTSSFCFLKNTGPDARRVQYFFRTKTHVLLTPTILLCMQGFPRQCSMIISEYIHVVDISFKISLVFVCR